MGITAPAKVLEVEVVADGAPEAILDVCMGNFGFVAGRWSHLLHGKYEVRFDLGDAFLPLIAFGVRLGLEVRCRDAVENALGLMDRGDDGPQARKEIVNAMLVLSSNQNRKRAIKSDNAETVDVSAIGCALRVDGFKQAENRGNLPEVGMDAHVRACTPQSILGNQLPPRPRKIAAATHRMGRNGDRCAQCTLGRKEIARG
ncbi:hypothetical protein BU26DRAFT_135285 [Trematosphaeria pertusa]|uniref:Uncharacterized protein n=1 Tax=Trematosphaeria pertusa TaxID=390896 RepID=A0A6A6IVZ4_9PLEO|nr:uncharacterized protein BU26DRAFT_135285 [Trematosphaeria pertusa]KAF2254247.1 hypothetical protein BU26DRAFT_135285 [Trematosphaeria pertusa]